MIFYFNSDGKLINSVPSNVYQGSNKASRIYFVCPTAKSNVISVAFTLPSGLYSSKRMLTRTQITGNGIGLSSGNGAVVNEEDVGFNVWEYDIPFSVTEYAGRVTVQFFIDNGLETVATQSVAFLVEQGSGVVEGDTTDEQYDSIIDTIATWQQSTANDINEVETLAESKSRVYFVAVTDTFTGTNPAGFNGFWYDYDGNDITSQIGTGNYINENCVNSVFNTQDIQLAVASYDEDLSAKYLIYRNVEKGGGIFTNYSFVVLQVRQIPQAFTPRDILYFSTIGVPERVYVGGVSFYAIENPKQPIDDTPTQGSQNPVTSAGVYNALQDKQDTLVSGVNIKTINGQPLTGAGNINIEGGGIVVDEELSSTSSNPVENRVINNALQDVEDIARGKTKTYILSYNDTFTNGQIDATWHDIRGNAIIPATGSYIDKNCINLFFNSQNQSVSLSSIGSKWIIFRQYSVEVLSKIDYIVVGWLEFASYFNRGDNIYVIENDVPDRWYAGGVQFHALEGNLSSKSAVTVASQIVQTFNADTKQDKLTAGENITIDENGVISSVNTHGGGTENWRLIQHIPTTEDITELEINQDIEGNPIKLKKARLTIRNAINTQARFQTYAENCDNVYFDSVFSTTDARFILYELSERSAGGLRRATLNYAKEAENYQISTTNTTNVALLKSTSDYFTWWKCDFYSIENGSLLAGAEIIFEGVDYEETA